MIYIQTVAVRECCNDLTKTPNSFLFVELTVSDYVIEKLTSFNVLQNEIPRVVVLAKHGESDLIGAHSSPRFSQTSYRLMTFG